MACTSSFSFVVAAGSSSIRLIAPICILPEVGTKSPVSRSGQEGCQRTDSGLKVDLTVPSGRASALAAPLALSLLATTMVVVGHVRTGEVVREAVQADHPHDVAGAAGGQLGVERLRVLVVDSPTSVFRSTPL